MSPAMNPDLKRLRAILSRMDAVDWYIVIAILSMFLVILSGK